MKKIIWNSTRILVLGFIGIILIGTLLLLLPIANRNGQSLPFLNALFTATSATCVTGLVLYDTWTQFTAFGQIVILLLIQLGGLGFMTAIIAILTLTRRQIGLKQRSVLSESVGITQLSGIVRLSQRILIGTAFFELLGAGVLCFRFIPRFGYANGIWCAIFHSVSAFCNAGFDILGRLSPGSSLTAFSNDPVVLLTISFLIIVGGVGFIVWNDLIDCRKEKRKLRLHTKVTLLATAALLIIGTVLLFLSEHNAAFRSMGFGEQLLNAFFHSVTPRTAGFNSVPMASLSESGKLMTTLLMFIGAAPGGTGGGVKITTFVVALLTLAASMRREKETSVMHYRLEPDCVRRVFCSITLYCCMALLGTLILCFDGIGLADALFECFSAIGTVGLTVGVTTSLGLFSKIVIILLMFAGRVGSFAVFLAVVGENKATRLSNPIGKIIVG